MEKVLEDACVKLSVFIADIFGSSGRMMLRALIAGERDPQMLAGYARSRMRSKIGVLAEALTGRFEAHHGFLIEMMLNRVEALDAAIEDLTRRIEVEITPMQHIVEQLDTIPGVNVRVAQTIIAEIGADMTRFPTRTTSPPASTGAAAPNT